MLTQFASVVLDQEIEIGRQARMDQHNAAPLTIIAEGKAETAVDSAVAIILTGYSQEIEDEDNRQIRVVVSADRRLCCGMQIRSKFHDALLAKDSR